MMTLYPTIRLHKSNIEKNKYLQVDEDRLQIKTNHLNNKYLRQYATATKIEKIKHFVMNAISTNFGDQFTNAE